MFYKYSLGVSRFGFIPLTYVIPQDLKLLKQNWDCKNGNGEETWIIKPVCFVCFICKKDDFDLLFI